MSLFAGLFKSAGTAADTSLFSSASKFKSGDDGSQRVLPGSKPPKAAADGKRKRSTVKESAAEAQPKAKKTKPMGKASVSSDPVHPGEEADATPAARPAHTTGGKRTAKQAAESAAEQTAAARRPSVAAKARAVATKTEGQGGGKRAAIRRISSGGCGGSEAPAAKSEAQLAAEEDKLQRTVFVGNLPAIAKRKSLARLFSQFGAVESARLRSVPLKADAKMPRRGAVASGNVDATRASGHAYVVFKESGAAEAALAHNMAEFEGHHLRVDLAGVNQLKVKAARKEAGGRAAAALAAQAPAVRYDPARSVFVGNLHIAVEDEELIRFFTEGVGGNADTQLEAVRVVRDPKTSIGKGIAFVLFKSKAGRRAALALEGRQLRGRSLRITTLKAGDGGSTSGAAPWQGAVATRTGNHRGLAGPSSSSAAAKTAAGKRKSSGKRPAVAARKARQLGAAGKAPGGGVKKGGKGGGK